MSITLESLLSGQTLPTLQGLFRAPQLLLGGSVGTQRGLLGDGRVPRNTEVLSLKPASILVSAPSHVEQTPTSLPEGICQASPVFPRRPGLANQLYYRPPMDPYCLVPLSYFGYTPCLDGSCSISLMTLPLLSSASSLEEGYTWRFA